MKITSWLISVLFHPLVMPAIGLLIIYQSGLDFTFFTLEQKRAVFLIVLLSTLIIPLSFIPFFLLKKTGFEIEMHARRDRILPFFITALIYLFTWYFLKRIGIPALLVNYIFASGIAVLFSAVITVFWKISIHMIGIGGITGLLVFISHYFYADVFILVVISFLLAGITGTARMVLNAHSIAQLFTGYTLGLVTIPVVLALLI